MAKYEVDEKFILEAHQDACNDWKIRIEKQFPELFPQDVIGNHYIVRDLSWHEHLGGPRLDIYEQRGVIVSKVFEEKPEESTINRKRVHILINKSLYKVLYNPFNVIYLM